MLQERARSAFSNGSSSRRASMARTVPSSRMSDPSMPDTLRRRSRAGVLRLRWA